MYRIIQEGEAIRHILRERDRYVCYLGAGASAEAGVMTALGICQEIRQWLIDSELLSSKDEAEATRKVESELKWTDVDTRYLMCMRKGFSARDSRVGYFRKLLQNVHPAFCHHAVALLMAKGYLKSTCLTTNFDKLTETAFMQQGRFECQPIRNESEIKYYSPDHKRRYILKLHGDYDTENVLNTAGETIRIADDMSKAVSNLCQRSGMLVLGTAGNENSIRGMFDYLAEDKARDAKVLSYGLLWGVYMNEPKPGTPLSDRDLEDKILKRIADGEVGKGIQGMLDRTREREEPFCLFPVWGAGNFLFSLVKATKKKELIGTAERYLDREMRLWSVFQRAQLEEAAIRTHITRLRNREKKLRSDSTEGQARSRTPTPIFKALDEKRQIEIRAIYGDITSRSMMSATEFRNLRRVVVSSEDTCLSAGGGVAAGLLHKAGPYELLNELQKFSPIEHDTVAVTSGGNLPVHYIFHAAAVEIQKNGDPGVSEVDVCTTMKEVLNKATALGVGAVWVPLMGTGLGPLSAKQSLTAILKAIVEWDNQMHKIIITIVLYEERELLPTEVIECAQAQGLPNVESLYPREPRDF